jgi:putative tricarboxylic transport membrane protein
LAALGVFFIQQALRGKQGAIRTEGHQTDWSALAVISAGLLSQPVLMESVGFVPSAILLFVLVAWGFGSRRLVRDLVIAVVLALAIHVGFTRLLNLQLPAGVLKGLL